MGKLSDIPDLTKPVVGGVPDFDSIPPERGTFTPPPQPGSYRFQFPKDMSAIWDPIDTTEYGKRLQATFDGNAVLVIVQSKENKHNGESFNTRISNVPRKRDKEGLVVVSDMEYLLRALGERLPRTASNKLFADALAKHAGEEFGADVEWSWSCNPRRAARFDDGSGGVTTVEDPASTLTGEDAGFKAGCGMRYYQNDVRELVENGEYPLTITCSNPECGARVRGFANLRNFKR